MNVEWIEVNKELPPKNRKVLVYIIGDADPEIVVSYWDQKTEEDDHIFVRWYYGDVPMYTTSWYQKVTHWMNLPEGPKNV